MNDFTLRMPQAKTFMLFTLWLLPGLENQESISVTTLCKNDMTCELVLWGIKLSQMK